MHLTDADAGMDTSSLFYMHSFPREWKTRDLMSALKEAAPVNIRWIDDTSALIVVRESGKIPVAQAIVEVAPSEAFAFGMMGWDRYQEQMKIGGVDLKEAKSSKKTDEQEQKVNKNGKREREEGHEVRKRKKGDCVIS